MRTSPSHCLFYFPQPFNISGNSSWRTQDLGVAVTGSWFSSYECWCRPLFRFLSCSLWHQQLMQGHHMWRDEMDILPCFFFLLFLFFFFLQYGGSDPCLIMLGKACSCQTSTLPPATTHATMPAAPNMSIFEFIIHSLFLVLALWADEGKYK